MSGTSKAILALGALSLAYWCLTTKNEVVESAVFPVKVKLGLADYANKKKR